MEINRSFNELAEDGTSWIFQNFAPNRYLIFIDPKVVSDSAITMLGVGTEVTKKLHIPFSHRLVFIWIHHLTSSYADTRTYTNFKMVRSVQNRTPSKLAEYIIAKIGIRAYTSAFKCGETFERPDSTYSLTLESANTDKIIPVIYVQNIGHSKVSER